MFGTNEYRQLLKVCDCLKRPFSNSYSNYERKIKWKIYMEYYDNLVETVIFVFKQFP